MTIFLGIISASMLIIISFFHFYWAYGGTYGLDSVIPTKENIDKVIRPKPLITSFVAVILLCVGLVYLDTFFHGNLIPIENNVKKYLLLTFSCVFILRSIGEFNYVGFFKRIKNTKFARNDSQYFSPLCLF